MSENTPDDAWLEVLRAERGGFSPELMAGVGEDMLAEAMQAVDAAEEQRLLRELTATKPEWDFPLWTEAYDPAIDDRGEEMER